MATGNPSVEVSLLIRSTTARGMMRVIAAVA